RPLGAHVRVAPAAGALLPGLYLRGAAVGARAGRVGAADVDPAGKRDAAVDHQDLAVVAVVELPAAGSLGRLGRVDRVELAHRRTGLAQPLEVLLRRADRAGAVVEHVHLHALRRLLLRELEQALADLAAFQDVGLEVDVVARGRHGPEHRAVRLRPVDQDLRLVAVERGRGDPRLRRL